MTTTTTPNLGKLFTSRTSRPATPEDLKILSPGDWISERQCSWSWQFRNFCQDMAVGVWEGKEFFIPTNLLMVCTVIEGNVVEKFLEPSSKFKVGDRFAVCPGVTNECEIIGLMGNKYRVRWSLKGDEQTVNASFLLSLRRVEDERWNPAHFGEVPHQVDADGQATIFFDDSNEPPEPDDFKTIEEFEDTWEKWEQRHTPASLASLNIEVLSCATSTSIKPVLPPDAPIAIILFAGGGGVEAGMVEAGIRPVIAVECDPKKPKLSGAIADCHDRNFNEYGCKVVRQTVQECYSLGFPLFPRKPKFLHSSQMCSSFSNAKNGATETPVDIEMASAVGGAIRQLEPEIFTLENVKRYADSQSFKIITQALEESGYIWGSKIITLLDCQTRERLILWAAKDCLEKSLHLGEPQDPFGVMPPARWRERQLFMGETPKTTLPHRVFRWLPPLPEPIQPVGWYEVIADLIPKMADSELVPGQQKSLEEFLSKNEPTPLLIQRTGARGEYRIKPAHLPCSTILRSHFTDGKGNNRNKFADIWLPDGTIKSLPIEAAARLQGFPDWYEFPPDTATAGSIIGYSVPPKFAAQLFKSLQQPPPTEVQIQMCQERVIQHNWHIQHLDVLPQTKDTKEAIKLAKGAIASEQENINQLLEELIIYRQFIALGCDRSQARVKVLKLILDT